MRFYIKTVVINVKRHIEIILTVNHNFESYTDNELSLRITDQHPHPKHFIPYFEY